MSWTRGRVLGEEERLLLEIDRGFPTYAHQPSAAQGNIHLQWVFTKPVRPWIDACRLQHPDLALHFRAGPTSSAARPLHHPRARTAQRHAATVLKIVNQRQVVGTPSRCGCSARLTRRRAPSPTLKGRRVMLIDKIAFEAEFPDRMVSDALLHLHPTSQAPRPCQTPIYSRPHRPSSCRSATDSSCPRASSSR
jgi:hypothetical protein